MCANWEMSSGSSCVVETIQSRSSKAETCGEMHCQHLGKVKSFFFTCSRKTQAGMEGGVLITNEAAIRNGW